MSFGMFTRLKNEALVILISNALFCFIKKQRYWQLFQNFGKAKAQINGLLRINNFNY